MFRSSNALPDASTISPEELERTEAKHSYVIQAVFDLHEWPECKDAQNPDCQDLAWHLKIFSSETLAIIKDTDKEDRERALKLSWEQQEPGRAEKAKKSRMKFVL